MKKYLFLLILPMLFLIPKDTFAFSLGTPTTYGDYKRCITPGASSSNCDSVSVSLNPLTSALVDFNGVNSYTSQWINGSPYSWGYINWDLGTMGYCQGQNVIVTGRIFIRNYTGVSITGLSAIMNGKNESCNFTVSQSGVIDYTCQSSANNGNYWQFILSFSQKNVSTDYLLGQEVTLSCSPRESQEIIANQNQNTQNIINNQNENTDKIVQSQEEVKDAITSEDAPDLDALEDSAGWLPPGPVDSILNLPLSLFQNLTDNLSKSCQPVVVELPYVNENITLPCVSTLYEQIGIQTFLNWVGLVVGALILYNYFLHLYKWVDDTLTFRENNWQDWGGV